MTSSLKCCSTRSRSWAFQAATHSRAKSSASTRSMWPSLACALEVLELDDRAADIWTQRGQVVDVAGSFLAERRGEISPQAVHVVPFEQGDQVGVGAPYARGVAADGVAPQAGQALGQRHVHVEVMAVKGGDVRRLLVGNQEMDIGRDLLSCGRASAGLPSCS